ncbi:uncharacterized protein G2W53_041020 [Senna tora]|uniref:Uncharacterized protein n=1 Tax=Senna tora TaxID=362788 RepID=A0A834SEI9_9FABA|nr:uncharacterized protein G2W53_041020 [Senna tora]
MSILFFKKIHPLDVVEYNPVVFNRIPRYFRTHNTEIVDFEEGVFCIRKVIGRVEDCFILWNLVTHQTVEVGLYVAIIPGIRDQWDFVNFGNQIGIVTWFNNSVTHKTHVIWMCHHVEGLGVVWEEYKRFEKIPSSLRYVAFADDYLLLMAEDLISVDGFDENHSQCLTSLMVKILIGNNISRWFLSPFVNSPMSPIHVQYNESIDISVDQLHEDDLRSLKLRKLNNMDNDDSDWPIGVHGPFHRNPDRYIGFIDGEFVLQYYPGLHQTCNGRGDVLLLLFYGNNRWTQLRALLNLEVTYILANKIFRFSSSLLFV